MRIGGQDCGINKTELTAQIKNAFMPAQLPGCENIAYDNSGIYLDVEEIKQNYSGKLWHELDHAFLWENRDGIYFFSKEAFKYYIPAFMIAAIENFDEMDDVPDIVVGAFTYKERSDIVEQRERLESYDPIPGMQKLDDMDEFEKIALGHLQAWQENFLERMRMFDGQQIQAIINYLKYMEQYYEMDELYEDPKIAIERLAGLGYGVQGI
jgi:hypothetical protein